MSYFIHENYSLIVRKDLFQRKQQICRETITVPPGCEIVNKHCRCWRHSLILCKENLENIERWDFSNKKVCCSGETKNFGLKTFNKSFD